MADNMVKVVVDMVVKGAAQVRGAADDIDKLGPAGAGATRGIGALAGSLAAAGGVMVAAGFAAKKLWDVMGEGAQLQTTALRFDKLTASIGSTSDAMLGNLRTATKGMISDAELMASASGIISLRLAENEEQVVRLATVVGTLGWDMQQVILTFANLSTMRLDALGLSVDEVKNKQKELMEQGMSTAAAFKEAVIQAGEARLDVGGVAENEQAMLRAAAAVDNFKASLLSSITATLEQAGAFDALSNAAAGFSAFSAFVADLERLRQTGEITEKQWSGLNAAIRRGGIEFAEAQLKQILYRNSLTDLNEDLGETADAVTDATGVLGPSTDAWQNYYINLARQGQITSAAIVESQMRIAASVGMADRALLNAQHVWGARGNQPRGSAQMQTNRYANWIADTNERNRLNEATRAATLESERAMYSYGGSVSYAITQEDALAAAHARLADAFSSEAMAKPEDGLINAEGLVNVEAMNDALYQQAQSAGASAVQLAMLGVATGKFTKEQAAAALKAAVLQETIRKVAEGVASGNVKYDDAVGYLEEFRQKLDASGGGAEDATANVEDLVGMAKELTEGPYTADISANTVQARGDLEAILDLINGISGVHQATIVVTSDGDTGGDGSPTPGGGPGGETPELITSGYILSPARGGPHDWQSGGGLHVNITNYVDGREVARTKLDDVTEDRMRHALQSIGWN